MTMTVSDENMDYLNIDALLDDAAHDPAVKPNETFMARVLDDALAQQPMPHLAPPSFWQQITTMFGGWQGMGGLVAATCAGFWIGISPPEGLPTQFDTFLNIETSVSFLDDENEGGALFGFGWNMEEG
jgi:hypothetical protein|tara:strand:- start:6716 stop:7099 length:384 start_codon:yes stop_codon:yes gene_type:complete